MPVEEADAMRRFKRANLGRERRLADAAGTGGAREAAGLGDEVEGTQQGDAHRRPHGSEISIEQAYGSYAKKIFVQSTRRSLAFAIRGVLTLVAPRAGCGSRMPHPSGLRRQRPTENRLRSGMIVIQCGYRQRRRPGRIDFSSSGRKRG